MNEKIDKYGKDTFVDFFVDLTAPSLTAPPA